jgi:hydroxylaminobenzene mutase
MNGPALAVQGHRLIQIGVTLFLLTSLQGLAVPYFAAPNLGRSVHTLSGFTGMMFLALGLVWPKLKLTPVAPQVAFWFLIYSAFATIAGFVIGALLGAGGFDLPDCGSRRTRK